MIALKQAVATLDGVIPAPDNKMVDLAHLPIAVAWQECKTALAAYIDMQDNAPLTREELLEMDGEPVWIEYIPIPGEECAGLWALVSIDKECDEIFLLNSIGGSSSYEEAWADIRAIYRHRPEVSGK